MNGKEIHVSKKSITSLGVNAVDDFTLEINLSQPTVSFFENLAVSNAFPVQKKNVEKHSDSFTQVGNLVSNGSYKLLFRKVGDEITVERNAYYWNNAQTYIEKANFYPIVDQNSEHAMYETGQIDITASIPINLYNQIKKKYGSEYINTPMVGTYSYFFNYWTLRI